MRLFLLGFGPTVFQADGAVKHQLLGRRVGVDTEVAYALELELVFHLGIVGEPGLYLGIVDDLERVGIEQLAEVALGPDPRDHGEIMLSQATPDWLRGPAVLASKSLRGRPAVPGDWGPGPITLGVDQLSRVTRACF